MAHHEARPAPLAAPVQGYAFATTGACFSILARRAARRIRAVSPLARFVLFTDQQTVDPLFDDIRRMHAGGFASKSEAMADLPFDRTMLLDADLYLVADISGVIDGPDRLYLAAVPGKNRQTAMMGSANDVPRCMPVLNTDLLALRRGAAMQDLPEAWMAP